MLNLPIEMIVLMQPFAPVFSERTWDWVKVLVVGAILAPGKRTVTSVLRVMGLSDESQFQRYHRVLNRAVWSSLHISQILLGLLVIAFVPPGGSVIVAADETLERRQGDKIKAKSVFRDAARSSKKHKVTSYGLRWVSMALLVPVPWSQRIWALPFLTVLAPSKKTNLSNGKRHKTSIDWVGQMIGQVRRWLPEHQVVLVVDGGLAAIKLGQRCLGYANPVTYVSRLRLDARLHDWPGPQPKGKPGRKPKKGVRQPSLEARLIDPATVWRTMTIDWYQGEQRTLDIATGLALWYTPGQDPLPLHWVLVRDPLGKLRPAAFFATDLDATPEQILAWVVMRWGIEVTFEETRAHLGLESQRQWSDLAIARTTPLYWACSPSSPWRLIALTPTSPCPFGQRPGTPNPKPPFRMSSLAFVATYGPITEYVQSPAETGHAPISATCLHGLVDLLCYAA